MQAQRASGFASAPWIRILGSSPPSTYSLVRRRHGRKLRTIYPCLRSKANWGILTHPQARACTNKSFSHSHTGPAELEALGSRWIIARYYNATLYLEVQSNRCCTGYNGPACVPAKAGETIAPSELASRIVTGNAPLILDVRTPGEYATGYIPGAINIPHTELRDRLSEVVSHQNKEIVVHCQTGTCAGVVQSILSRAGFTQIRELEGHMRQWNASDYPIE